MAEDKERRCYICGRTEEEVRAYFTCINPDEREDDPPFMDSIGTLYTTLPVCFGCRELLETVATEEIIDSKEDLLDTIDKRMAGWLDVLAKKMRCEDLPDE
jgi:hypothetical protein